MTDLDLLDREVPALAHLLVGRYGERALAFASLQALKARARSRPLLMEAWLRIRDAAHAILSAEPEAFVVTPSREYRVERIAQPALARVETPAAPVKPAFNRAL